MKVNAIVLAAGKGTRLGSLTQHKPKPLLTINSHQKITLLSDLLDKLLSSKISSISIVLGYLKSKMNVFFDINFKEEQENDKIRLIDSGEDYLKGPLYSLLSAYPHIQKNTNNPLLVFPADTYFQDNLIHDIIKLASNNYELAVKYPLLFYKKVSPPKFQEQDQVISLSGGKEISIAKMQDNSIKNQEILTSIEKQTPSPSNQLAQIIPIFSLPKKIFDLIHLNEKSANVKTLGGMINYLISIKSLKVYCYQITASNLFFDIDSISDLNDLRQYLEKKGDNSNSQK